LSGTAENLIEFRCPLCSKRLKAKAKLAGRRMRCPNCSDYLEVPQTSSNSSLSRSNAGEISATELLGPDNPPAANLLAGSDQDQPSQNQSPLNIATPHNSFDVDNLQLESLAIDNLDDRYQSSKEIREEKERKLLQELAAEKRRRQEYGRPRAEFDDEYQLQPATESNRNAVEIAATLPTMPMLSPDLLPEIQAPAIAGANQQVASSVISSPIKTPSPEKVAQSETVDDPGQDSYGFYDEIVEDKFRVSCPTCGTIQYVGIGSSGSQTKCPDCFSSFTIPKPPYDVKPSKILARHQTFDTDSPLENGRDLQHIDRLRKQHTEDLLEKAQVDLENEKDSDDRYRTDFDTQTFLRQSFGFLYDPIAIAFIFVYGLIFALVFALIQFGVTHSDDGEFGAGSALFCTVVGPLIGLLFGLPLMSAAMAQLEAVANHQAKVVDWPGFDMFDNLGDLLSVSMALAMSVIPGFLLGAWLGGGLMASGRFEIAGAMFSVLFLFPIFFLSILDNGSLLQLISTDVLRSMKEVYEAWAVYYFKSAIFISVTMLLWFLLLGKGKSAGLAAIAGASFPILVFFIFQQVGSLADLIGEHLSFSFERHTESAEIAESKPVELEDAV
jgi:hypothetical protein